MALCVGPQPFLIGAFSNFTTPMLLLGAMDLVAAVMLLCAAAHRPAHSRACPAWQSAADATHHLAVAVGGRGS